MASRRLAGWGFAGTSFPPSDELLGWLRNRLGETSPQAAVDLSKVGWPAPRSLPELGVACSVDPLDRLAHSRGQGLPDVVRLRSGAVPALPDGVARPDSAEQLAAILRAAGAADVRIIPWGGGTSVTGGVNVPASERPVVTVDLQGLSGLESIDLESGLATFGAGTLGPRVEAALEPYGLTLGHFPQSWELSSLGGWVVTRSSGQESLRNGRIEDLVAGLEVLAPAGRLSLSPRPASAAGPDLRQLVMGSEGRLGVVTRVSVRVRPRPAMLRIDGALLPSWAAGLAASRALLRERLPLALLRLSDEPETEVAMAVGLAARRLAPLAKRWLTWRGVAAGCLVLYGAADHPARVRATLRRCCAILARHGGVSLGQSPGRRWLEDRFRHPYLRDALLDLGIATDTLETAVPWSGLGELATAVRRALRTALEPEGERVAVLCHLSHPYADGASLYFTFFFRCTGDPEATIARWAALKRAATEALVRAGGTLSHHHGVGRWHAPWLEREIGGDGVRILQQTARLMDPGGVLNPGVLLDPLERLEA